MFISDTGERLCMFIVQVSWDHEVFESVEFYLEGGLEMTIHWHLGRGCTFIIQVFQNTGLFESIQFYSDAGTEISVHWWKLGKGLHIHCADFSEYTAIWVIIVLMRRWPWNDHLLMTLEKRLCMIIFQVFWDSGLFQSVELYLGDVFKWQWQHRVNNSAELLLRSPQTELFDLAEFYSEGQSWNDHLFVALGKRFFTEPFWVSSYAWEMLLKW